MNTIFEQLKGNLIVSCQAEEGSPFNSPEEIGNFARCAEIGGASGIRSCGIEKTKYLLEHSKLPIVGLTKSYFEDGYVCITGSFREVEELVKIRTQLIAVDGTFRLRANGMTGAEFIKEIKERYNVLVMADISTKEEAVACREAGADCVSTTLCGYTPYTTEESKGGPSLTILKNCVEALPNFPVFAEGRYNAPLEAANAMRNGAWAVIVGSAITRPHLITKWFVDAINKK